LDIPADLFSVGLSRHLAVASAVGTACAIILLVRSLLNFSQTGPKIQDEIRRHYLFYSIYALLRLGFWAFLIAFIVALLGSLQAGMLAAVLSQEAGPVLFTLAAILAVVLVTGRQFLHYLLYKPSLIMVSCNFRISRLYPLWRWLTPGRLRVLDGVLLSLPGAIILAYGWRSAAARDWVSLGASSATLCAVVVLIVWGRRRQPEAIHARSENRAQKPNVLMIGADTLRADHLGANGYHRDTSPFIDELAARGSFFSQCYVPSARTAPSLISLLTSTWPRYHGIRTNFAGDAQTSLGAACMPRIFREAGYETITISDWTGSDFGKFDLGFEKLDVPPDQWNLKYLIRQGPKDIRLFLSLFTHNALGKKCLPEIYYLAGVPLTAHLGRTARRELSRLARSGKPFLLNVFMGTTHPPFGSDYPYYTWFADDHYAGESKFAMSRLSDPDEIIRSQKEPKEAFDLDQIINLYDGSIRQFDEEARGIVEHLRSCGLEDNTIVVLYSDHGMEFFEYNTWGQGNNIQGAASPRIPLIVFDPRQGRPSRHPNVVRSIDLMPTLLELCGLPVPASVQGQSLAGLMAGRSAPANLPAYFETGEWLARPPGQHPQHLTYPELLELLEIPDTSTGTLAIKPCYETIVNLSRDTMLRNDEWKLERLALNPHPLYRLFNIRQDPHCRFDLSLEMPEMVDALRKLLDQL
jgi:arylsulfatase A-like enzyme